MMGLKSKFREFIESKKISREVYNQIEYLHSPIQSSLNELFGVVCPNPKLTFWHNGSMFTPANTINLDYADEKGTENMDADWIKSSNIDTLIEEEAHRHAHYANPKRFTIINLFKGAPCHEVSEGVALYARVHILNELDINQIYRTCLDRVINKGNDDRHYVARMLLKKDEEYFREFVRLPINHAWQEVEDSYE